MLACWDTQHDRMDTKLRGQVKTIGNQFILEIKSDKSKLYIEITYLSKAKIGL